MKKILNFLILICVIISCEKEEDNIHPVILLDKYPRAYESIKISVTEYIPQGHSIYEQYHFDWSILNEQGERIDTEYKNCDSITWMPETIGNYTIQVNITNSKKESLSASIKIYVIESPASLQRKLIGKWKGEAVTKYDLVEWKLDVSFDNIGHYVSKEYDVSNSLNWKQGGAFFYARHTIDDSNGYRKIDPSEDVPCTRFQILKVIDGKGYGVLSVSFERESKFVGYVEYCGDLGEINDLQFSTDGKEVTFSIINPDDNRYGSNWYINYKLTRIE